MGWQRWRTKSGHPTRLTAFLGLPSPQRSQSPRSVGGTQHSCSLPAVAREGDAIEDTRGVHSGWGARGAASPRTHRPLGHLIWGPGLTRTSGPPCTGSCEQKSKRCLQPNSLKGAGGVRPSNNVETSVAFSPDRCKGERSRCRAGRLRHRWPQHSSETVTFCGGHNGVCKILAIKFEDLILDDVDGQDFFLDDVDSQGLAGSGQVDPGRENSFIVRFNISTF